MTSRERWIARTRESVTRRLADDGVPQTAGDLVDNLDITRYLPSLGTIDQRTEREISAALRWLVEQGYAEEVHPDYPGQFAEYGMRGRVAYQLTVKGTMFAIQCDSLWGRTERAS